MKNEPAITIGAISAAVAAIIALLVSFGIDLTEAQTTAILGVVAAIGPIVAAVITRARVSPVGKYADRDGVMDGKVTPPHDPNVRA